MARRYYYSGINKYNGWRWIESFLTQRAQCVRVNEADISGPQVGFNSSLDMTEAFVSHQPKLNGVVICKQTLQHTVYCVSVPCSHLSLKCVSSDSMTSDSRCRKSQAACLSDSIEQCKEKETCNYRLYFSVYLITLCSDILIINVKCVSTVLIPSFLQLWKVSCSLTIWLILFTKKAMVAHKAV